jgi:hypothetical protein
MWDVVWDQFSRSVRNISDNNLIYQLFGASIGTLPNQTLQHNPKDNIVMADPTYPSNEDPPRGGEQGARPVRVPVLSVVCEPCGLRERYDVESPWRVSLERLSHRLRALRACWKLSPRRPGEAVRGRHGPARSARCNHRRRGGAGHDCAGLFARTPSIVRCFSPSANCLSTLLSRSQIITRAQPADWSASATGRSRATLDASLGSQ